MVVEEYSVGDSDFVTPAKVTKTKAKTMPAKKSKNQKEVDRSTKKTDKPRRSKEEGQAAAWQRVRKAKKKSVTGSGGVDKELELALALSISEQQDQVNHLDYPKCHLDYDSWSPGAPRA